MARRNPRSFIALCCLLAVANYFYACESGTGPQPTGASPSTGDPQLTGGPGIYVVGTLKGSAVCWKNDIPVKLSGQEAYSVAVSENVVYVAGIAAGPNNTFTGATWSNGVVHPLGGFAANSIVVSGTDVYVAATDITYNTKQRSYELTPVYYKNYMKAFQGAFRPIGSYYPSRPLAFSIAISGTDVYVAGAIFLTAAYLKNGVAVGLEAAVGLDPSVSYFPDVKSIAVSGDDVYVAGNSDQATYWKNGNAVNLSKGPTSLIHTTSVFVSGNDVYFAGVEGGIAKYWKNETAVTLPEGSSDLTSIFVSGDDVYVTGKTKFKGTGYWKNGVEVVLSTDTDSKANSIFVVK